MTSRKISTITAILIVLFGFNISLQADSDNSRVGTRAFNFLKIEVAARPVSMGGAFTGIADDESALYYNPAGMAALEGKRYILGYHNSIFDMQSGFVGYMHPLDYDKKLAIYVDYLNYGEFIRTDNTGEELGTFSGSDFLLGIGFAMDFNEDFQVGAVGKLIYEKIDVYAAHGFAFDLGVRKVFDYGRTTVGLMVQNLGVQLSTFIEDADTDPLPLRFRAGASHQPRGLPARLVGDIILPTDNDLFFAIGLEIIKTEPLFLRLGWTSFGSNYKTGASGEDIGGFSAGFGLKYQEMQISYAVSPQAELGTSHRVTLTGGFN
jgi:hypothetical protein